MNMSHRQMSSKIIELCEERKHPEEETSQERNTSEDIRLTRSTCNKEEANPNDEPQTNDKVCTFASGDHLSKEINQG